MNPETWVASGHVGGFSDPLMDCKECKSRHRADKLIEDFAHEKGEDITVDGWSKEKMVEYITENNIVCPKMRQAKTLRIFVNLTLCSRHSKVLQKILHQ